MKNYLSIILIIAYIIIYPSCGEDITPIGGLIEENGVIVSVPYEWKRNLHKQNKAYSNSIIRGHLVSNGNPIIATTEGDGDRWINLIDIETGEDIWKWNDNFEGSAEYFDIQDAYFYNNLMTYQIGSRSYCINLDNGNTLWKNKGNISFDYRLTGFEDDYFLTGPTYDTLINYNFHSGYQANITKEQKNNFLFTDILYNTGGEGNLITSINRMQSYIHTDGKKYLIVASNDPYPNWYMNTFIGLYDYETKQWVYNRKIVSEPVQEGDISNIEIIDDKIYLTAGRSMNCHDLWTGEQIWRKETNSIFLFSNFIVEQNKVIGQDESATVYAWNAETGTELWKVAGAGTSSRLRYLNGIVYFSGGSTSRIHAIDISTGKTVWLLDASKMEKGADDFKPDIYAIEGKNGEKGKIVVCTPMNAYCLEAYQ
jgi:outer membrane protein assembly factor BamB